MAISSANYIRKRLAKFDDDGLLPIVHHRSSSVFHHHRHTKFFHIVDSPTGQTTM